HESNQVAYVHHAHGIIERVVVDHKPGVTSSLKHAHEFAQLDFLLHGDDIRARDHDVADAALAQAKNIFKHPAFFRREAGFPRTHDIKDVLEVSADGTGFPTEQRAQCAHEPVITTLLGCSDGHRQVARLEWRPRRARTG